MKSSGKIFLTFLGGAAAGALAGVLLAPEKGKKSREVISKSANNLKKSLEDNVNISLSKFKNFTNS